MKRELEILRKADALTEPTMAAEADAIGSPSELAPLIDAGLIRGQVLPDGNGMPCGVVMLGLTYEGKSRLADLQQKALERRPTAKAGRWLEKLAWMIAGAVIAVVVPWLAKKLGIN